MNAQLKWRIAIFGALAITVAGCAQFETLGYYAQAAHGQLSLLSEARPIDDWLADPTAPEKLKVKLRRVREIRRFAAAELGLPDNESYKSYADLKRPYVSWNIVATPELSMTPEQWCFPVAGCVNYRGYYDKADAQAYAKELRKQGLDVQVSGVPAYSTLGWFNDPVLSTFIQYPDGELARLVFHELAHQVAYTQDDSQFNESFATAVEEMGLERWMATQADDRMRQIYVEYEGRKRDFLALLLKYRKELEANYARKLPDADKRAQKRIIFEALKDEYQVIKAKWGGYAGYDRWFAEPLSNAHLASVATYHDYVPAFHALRQQQGSFPEFYAAVQRMAGLDKSMRQQQLALLGKSAPLAARNRPPETVSR